jgi:hypothetical protein
VEDVARCFRTSLSDRDSIGKAYDLCGPHIYTLAELVRYAGMVSGHPRPIIPLSDRLSYLQAWAMEWLPSAHVARQLQLDAGGQRVEGAFPSASAHRPRAVSAYLGKARPRSRYNGSATGRPLSGHEAYRVGGSVRDELLGMPVADRDHVVVGSTPEEMERLGYKPVGKDFPVFLHPQTHEEYALARTERKVARGYKGFKIHASPEVTLEQDLERRDQTINALARDGPGSSVPLRRSGRLERRLLRHVSPAFVEDPVRILRVARFAARFGFEVAPETMALMRSMVANGEADALVPERTWQEFSRGLMEGDPGLMFPVLAESGLLAKLLG